MNLDAIVWPNNGSFLNGVLDCFKAIMSLRADCAAWVSMPLPHAQTTTNALIKHRRYLEDYLIAAKFEVTNQVSVLYKKPSHAGDERPQTQQVLFVTPANQATSNGWHESEAYKSQTLSQIPMISVSQMLGYEDGAAKPGAAARIEQLPVWYNIFSHEHLFNLV